MNQSKRLLPAVVVVILLILIAVVYGISRRKAATVQNPSATTQSMTSEMPGTQSANMASNAAMMATESASTSAATGTVKEFTVSGGNYYFTPKTLTVHKGDTVKITFKNAGGFHDFVIDEFNVKTQTVPSNQTATVQFVADKTGTFQYYCSVDHHRTMGMQGTLTVQ